MLNPDVEIPRQFKIKEHHVRDELLHAFPDTELVFDKKIDRGCSLRRPDVRIECFTHTVIVEVDENKHQGYSCENKRTMEIFQDLGNRPIVFIRFNPDKCSDRISAFTRTKRGYVSKNRKEFNYRIKELKAKIKEHVQDIPEREVTTVHMYFD